MARNFLGSLLLLAGLAVPSAARAQQPDSAPVRDSVQRDSIARADSMHADSVRRSELARIRGEPRARVADTSTAGRGAPASRGADEVAINAASVAGDMIVDGSPRAAARAPGSRIRMRDIEGSLGASYGAHVRGIVTLTLTDDGTEQRLTATDAAAIVRLPVGGVSILAGRSALPFGRSSQLHRHELLFPDQPLPVRVLLGADGLRGTGVQVGGGMNLSGARVTLQLAAADRFGTRVDSLHPGEAYDQAIAGIAAGGRLGARFDALASRVDLGVSSITGKREQPIGCVYEGTVGPVPCPEAVNAANTRLTVLGADAQLAWRGEAIVVSGEWMRMVVGATDLPVFSNAGFVPFYSGVSGTYDGGYAMGRLRLGGLLGVGARGEWLQNPEVHGLNDGWAGGFVDFTPLADTHLIASYQRRTPSSSALGVLPLADRDARDRVVLRGTIVVGRHPSVERD